MKALATLRRFARLKSVEPERCDLCGTKVSKIHPHLAGGEKGRPLCSCAPCAQLFSSRPGMRFQKIQSRLEPLPDFVFTDELWSEFGLPVNLAFFYESRILGKVVAYYPSPAGTLESLLPMTAWYRLVERNPVLAAFEADVDALLVDKTRAGRGCFRASLDECYRLAGLIRLSWRGLSGGPEVERAIDDFFAGRRLS